MRRLLLILLTVALGLAFAACSSNTPNSSEDLEEALLQSEQVESKQPEEYEAIKSDVYTLPCGMNIQFFDSVQNDATGNWRRAATSDSLVPADYALEYYNEMFSSDDEVHSIWNSALGTTTRIVVYGNLLFVDTLEYVDGEEHDANLMFSGEVLESKVIDIETGEEVQGSELSTEPGQSDEPEDAAVQSSAPNSQPVSEHTSVPAATPSSTPEPTPSPTPETTSVPTPEPTPVLTPEPTQNPTQSPVENSAESEGGNSGESAVASRDNWPQGRFLGSLQSDKYHSRNCRAAARILPENEIWFDSEDAAQAAGYSRCGICW